MSLELAYKKECTMPETANPTYVGLDISKARLDYTLDDSRTPESLNHSDRNYPGGDRATVGGLVGHHD